MPSGSITWPEGQTSLKTPSRHLLGEKVSAKLTDEGAITAKHAAVQTARRAPVTAREVRAAAGTSALGVGGGPYEKTAPFSIVAGLRALREAPLRYSCPFLRRAGLPQGHRLHNSLILRGVSLALCVPPTPAAITAASGKMEPAAIISVGAGLCSARMAAIPTTAG